MALDSASKVLDALCEFLDQGGVKYDKQPERNQVYCQIKKGGIRFDFFGLGIDGGEFIWFAVCNKRGEERVRRELVAFTTLVNNSIDVGNFIVLLDRGEVQFKTMANIKNIRKCVVMASVSAECDAFHA